MISGSVLEPVARHRPTEQPAGISEHQPRSLGVSAIDDLVDESDDVGTGNISNGSLVPAWDKLPPDQLLDSMRRTLTGDVAHDESLRDCSEGIRLFRGRGARVLSLAHSWIDAVLQLAQRVTGTRPCLGEGKSRIASEREAYELALTVWALHHAEGDCALLADATAEAGQQLIPNLFRVFARLRERVQQPVAESALHVTLLLTTGHHW